MKGYLVWLIVALACGSMAELLPFPLPSNRDKIITQELEKMNTQLNAVNIAIKAKKSRMVLRQNEIETVLDKMSTLYKEIAKLQNELLSENLKISKVNAQPPQEECPSSEKVNEYVQQIAKERADKMIAGEREPKEKTAWRERLIMLREQSVLNFVPKILD
nr:uncharacterized protein LOC108074335 [Drosophila kikkawai]